MQRLGAAAWLVALALVAGAGAAPRADEEPVAFGLKEVLDGTYSARGMGGVWVSEKEIARRTSAGAIEVYNVDTKATTTLLQSSALGNHNKNLGTWTLSADKNKLLWSYDVKAGFRHSTEAKYAVYNFKTKGWQNLHQEQHLQTALLSPQGDGLAYVYENNVYFIDNITASASAKEVTRDGSVFIYNGVPDWVYEEEVLSSGSAMWFSPNGSFLVYAKFNDTNVTPYTYITYGTAQYTKGEVLFYPKPGTDNPIVTLHVANLTSKEIDSKLLITPDTGVEILQNVAWVSNETVIVTWLNRIQNNVTVSSYKPPLDTSVSWVQNIEFTETETQGWLDVGTPLGNGTSAWVVLWPHILNGQRFTLPTIFRSSGTGQAQVLNLIDAIFNVTATALYGWDVKNQRILFQATPPGVPAQRHVYSINDLTLFPWACVSCYMICLSCSLVQPYEGGTACLYASASFSTDFSRAAFTCSGPGPAAVRLATIESGMAAVWGDYLEENKDLIEKLSKRKLPSVEGNFTLEVAPGIVAQARLWLPPNLDKSKKYPMIVHVYGGPGSQQVSESFSVNWGSYLTTNKSYIYASIDGRGSGFQGSNTLYALYKKLGTVEVQDQIGVTQALVKAFPYIDATRVGIWGWSYGGYATAMAMAQDTGGTFRCGASVAPVTSWDLYDSIYTERYMDLPSRNEAGYKAANISNKIANFEKHEFYLLHGNADDNVHYQQAMRLARALEENNIFFLTQSYPDENHSIRSVVQHVYMSMTVFFDECLAPLNSAPTKVLLPALLLFPLLTRLLA